jgi:hypothetical protein
MFFVRIDAVDTRNVTGFECGTRAEFDKRWGGNPLWAFVDSDVVRAGIKVKEFLLTPTNYTVNTRGILKKKPKVV